MRERLAALEMISGFVDDAPSGDGLEHGKRFDGLGRHGQRISGKLYKIRVVSGSDCTDGMIPCAALGGIDGIGFEGVERGDSLIWAENAPRRGCAVDGGMDGTLEYRELGCVCKPSSRNRVTTGKCATMTSLKTSGSGLSPYCQQKVLLVEGDRLVTSETFSMLYIGCCEPDLHGELCQRNMVRGKPYIPDSGVGRKEDI